MINNELINPHSIAVIGASNDLNKAGGKMLYNILSGGFEGEIYPVNPKENLVQGLTAHNCIDDLPELDLAILAIAAHQCPQTVEQLAVRNKTKAFIIISAGFGEVSAQGQLLENQLVQLSKKHKLSITGPNCIGILNQNYHGVFTSPIPQLDANGCDLISSSGATAVFLMEAGMQVGLRFSSVYSVGNGKCLAAEDYLQNLDETFDPLTSSKTKLLYLENINNPQKLLNHAASLIKKGCRIAAIKSGVTEQGSRAASSHTGALASSDMAIRALFRKAGIVYCSSREELISVASVFSYPELTGKNIAVITHAGGSAVMLTDTLSKGGLDVPLIEGDVANELLTFLHTGSSVSNPIDFLATGTAEQLGIIIDYCEHKMDQIDAMIVVFGSPGLFDVENVYKVLTVKLDVCNKPIYPVLPSVINAEKAIKYFLSKGHVNFPDEVLLGKALCETYFTESPKDHLKHDFKFNTQEIRNCLQHVKEDGYLTVEGVNLILDSLQIPRAKEVLISSESELERGFSELNPPLVMKAVGPLHKTDVGGVVLDINSIEVAWAHYHHMLDIADCNAVMLQEQISGTELFLGVKYEEGFGHLMLMGLGGIFVEVFKDIRVCLCPCSREEIQYRLSKLKCYPIIKGVRGQKGINMHEFVNIIEKISYLTTVLPELKELDLNPLIGNQDNIVAVDMRLRVKQERPS